ncbi:MAG: STT3 domain-containing protein [archaeon]
MKKHRESEDEDISFDFSWIRKMFSGKKEFNFFRYLPILLLIIPLSLSFYIRSIPSELPIADEWAKQSILNNVKNQISAQVSQQYPNLPDQSKQVMIDEQFQTFMSQQGAQANEVAKQQAVLLREKFRYGEETYLGDIDSYFWLRYARNIEEKGQIGDELKEGVPWDNHMQAPNGYGIPSNIYPYLEVYLHKFLKIFDSSVSLMRAAFLTPMFLSFIAIICAFFIGKKLSGNLAGFIAAILIAVNPTVLSRSLGSDNDIVNTVFPLLIMLFVIYAFDSKNYKNAAIYGILAGISTAIYQLAWGGWWFMFLLIMAGGFMYLGYIVFYEYIGKQNITDLMNNKKLKLVFTIMGFFIASTFIFLTMTGNSEEFLRAIFNSPIKVITIQQASHGISLWPNVYTTVAELNTANISQVIGSVGGKIFMWLALLGTITALTNLESEKFRKINLLYLLGSAIYFLIYLEFASTSSMGIVFLVALIALPLLVGLLLSSIYQYKIDSVHSIILAMWFIATIYSATKGVRFILLLIPAFVISFSVLLDNLVKWSAYFSSKALDLNIWIPKTIFMLLVLIVLVQPVNSGISIAYNYIPSVNDGWVESLEKIKTESQPDAIINSWWDFGHWFKYWADRKVTFDGASQDGPNAHWIGKVLITEDEDQAVSILRMLDCGGDKAGWELSLITNDTHEAVSIIYRLFKMDKDNARKELLKTVSPEQADRLMPLIFCEPPEDYFITSQDMVGKSGVWAHFGSWNFERAKIYSYFVTLPYDGFVSALETDLGYNQEDAQKIFYELNSFTSDRQINDWIAAWPSYGGVVGCSQLTNESIQCNLPGANGQALPLQINTITMEAKVQANVEYHPNRFGYLKDGEYVIKEYTNNTIGYGIALLGGNDVLFMTPELVGSMFTRMFYLDGAGLRKFDKFYDTVDVTGQKIITWKVNWER